MPEITPDRPLADVVNQMVEMLNDASRCMELIIKEVQRLHVQMEGLHRRLEAADLPLPVTDPDADTLCECVVCHLGVVVSVREVLTPGFRPSHAACRKALH